MLPVLNAGRCRRLLCQASAFPPVSGRYILILMGLFAVYVGFLYNDFFGLMIAPFGADTFWFFPLNDTQRTSRCTDDYSRWFGGKNASSVQVCCPGGSGGAEEGATGTEEAERPGQGQAETDVSLRQCRAKAWGGLSL